MQMDATDVCVLPVDSSLAPEWTVERCVSMDPVCIKQESTLLLKMVATRAGAMARARSSAPKRCALLCAAMGARVTRMARPLPTWMGATLVGVSQMGMSPAPTRLAHGRHSSVPGWGLVMMLGM